MNPILSRLTALDAVLSQCLTVNFGAASDKADRLRYQVDAAEYRKSHKLKGGVAGALVGAALGGGAGYKLAKAGPRPTYRPDWLLSGAALGGSLGAMAGADVGRRFDKKKPSAR